MPRAISPGPAGLKFWRAPGLSADNTADIGSLPAGISDQFNPWGPKRPVQDWVWGNLCLYPPSVASTFPADAGSYALTGSDVGLIPGDIANLPAGGANWFNPWGPKRTVQDWFRGPIPAVPVTFTADSGSYALTGSAIALALGHVAGAGSYTITGADAGLTIPGGLVAAAGSYILTGSDAALTVSGAADMPAGMTGGYVPWGRPFPVNLLTSAGRSLSAPGPVILTAADGSYTLTGSVAGLVTTSTDNLPAGAVNWFNPWGRRYPVNLRTSTGRTLAEEAAPVVLTAAGGSYVITGTAAALTVTGAVTLTAAAGSYAITGSSAALALGFTANSGSYTVSGTAAVLARGYAAGAGAYAITGTEANLVQAGSITLACEAGSYTLTSGSDVSFIGVIPPTVEQPGGGYTGSRVGRGRMIRRRKRGELDIPPDLEPPLLSPSPPDLQPPAPGPKPPDLLPPQPGLMADMPMPQHKPLPPAPDDEDEDEIALLLKLLS